MILVDTSVWVDFFRNAPSPQAEWLDRHLGTEAILVGDLVLAEVLQGFKSDKGFDAARKLLGQMEQVEIAGTAIAIEAARHYRHLRSAGVTVRGTVDVLIATRCITDGLRLLHSDRDFDGFEKHLGLRAVDCAS